MKILMVLTSHDRLGDTGRKTGFWLEEFAAPYYVFKEAGAELQIASPRGGQPPLDPKSNEPQFQTERTRRFEKDPVAMAALASTAPLASVSHDEFDALFYPGGHGPMWDLAEDPVSIRLLERFYAAGKPVALVCHAPAALRHVRAPGGRPLVEGRRVTGFTNSEETAMGLTKVVPFLLEDELKSKGAIFCQVSDWEPLVVTDGLLVTGQNPASSGPGARALLAALAEPGTLVAAL
jgi:putative intracellular protease/amidase